MKTQRALEPRHMRQLVTDLSMGITDEMPKWAAIAWIEHAAALREIVETILKADPDGVDFSRLMSRLKVSLGLRFSDQARAILESKGYEIVEFLQDLCYETLGSCIKKFSYSHHSRFLSSENGETRFRIQEVAWVPRVRSMLIPSTRNLGFESVQVHFNVFADTIRQSTKGEAKAIIPNVALSAFLFSTVQDSIDWDRVGLSVWTTDISIMRKRHVVSPGNYWIYLGERDKDYKNDDTALLKVIVPVSC
jgi:hypothetical protein